MSEPSIKGTAFQSVLLDVYNLVESGRITRDELEGATKPEDRDLLGATLVPGIWYPFECYVRLLELLWRVDGKNEPGYLISRGARASERILAAGAYADMVDTAGRWGGEQVLKSVLNLSKSLFDFVEIDILGEIADDHFEIAFRSDCQFPDVARYASQGFFQPLFERLAGCPVRIDSRRVASKEIRFSVAHA